ncbi:MAG: hypothetical protein KC593_06810 [Myxococcales bacterium]|nr:hypothetical protein [Myxococcales bacterium]MCB9627669.1 hypothetical protein [Sandaracinaceae bacterium]
MAVLLLGSSACELRPSNPDPVFSSPEEGTATPPRIPGATCAGPRDCAADQVCSGAVCVAARTCVRAELLSVAAAQQAEAGDPSGAADTYVQAIEAFDAASVTPPGATLCRAAHSMLIATLQADARERAARMADRCLRGTLPGDPLRARVIGALGRMRYDGLNLAAFDLPEPPERYFTEAPARPDPNRVQVTFEVTPLESRAFDPIVAALQGDAARAAAQDCFLQDWEVRHEQEASAGFQVRFFSRLRDMGSYDTYPAELELDAQSLAQEGFEPCLARALPGVVELPSSLSRVVSYETAMTVHAALQGSE